MKKSIITGLCALLAVLYIFKVYKINTEFKSPKEEIIPFGTERESGDGVSMKVNGCTILSKEEVNEKYDYDLMLAEEVKIVLVTVTYFNETDKSKTVDTRPNSIEKTGYSTATEMEFYHICNSLGLEFELKGGEEKEIILPYILFKSQFMPSEWGKIGEEVLYISNSRYPVKTKWMLK